MIRRAGKSDSIPRQPWGHWPVGAESGCRIRSEPLGEKCNSRWKRVGGYSAAVWHMKATERMEKKPSGVARTPEESVAAIPATGPTARRIGVLIVDDHPMLRQGLVRVIDQTPDLQVCCEAGDAAQALDRLRESKPGLVVVDIALGSQNGLELIKDIKARYPDLPILVHSMYDEGMYAERCLRAGARGYVMKREPPSRLLSAARQVLSGEVALSETMTKQLLCRMLGGSEARGNSPADVLSDRELEVFELLGQGYRTKEIAQELHLSDKTVQTYREHIKEKLELQDAVALVRRATQWVQAQV
jgi:DNA-binding NarL/FixJ family response regulator